MINKSNKFHVFVCSDFNRGIIQRKIKQLVMKEERTVGSEVEREEEGRKEGKGREEGRRKRRKFSNTIKFYEKKTRYGDRKQMTR